MQFDSNKIMFFGQHTIYEVTALANVEINVDLAQQQQHDGTQENG